MSGVVVIGAGQAAASFAVKFRSLNQTTAVTIVGDEPFLPYQRPPLSKKYATRDMSRDQLLLRPENWYGDNDVILRRGVSVSAVNRDSKTIKLDDGNELEWDKLVFATGSRPRRLPEILTKGLEGIHYLRSLEDADAFGDELLEGRNVVIVGGGYIGLEAAAVCAVRGMNVTLVEASERILQRVACKETSDWFRALHEKHGVVFNEGVGLDDLSGEDGRVSQATLSDGTVLNVDFVLVGIGIVPNAELAKAAGLEVDGGIVVDAFCQTRDKDVFAAGDCAAFFRGGELTRIESVPNAIDQATAVAINMNSEPVPYEAKPWFWSDQYDVKLQIAGLNRGYDMVVVRQGNTSHSVSHLYYKGEELLAVDAMNEPRVYMVSKRLLEAGKSISVEQAMDHKFDLKSLL
jgi:3-phenylpropionate/trans-cinnamate dioxygenase ferredoxin reductase subunit